MAGHFRHTHLHLLAACTHIPSEEQAEILEDFTLGQARVTQFLNVKLGFWESLPCRLTVIDHFSEDAARSRLAACLEASKAQDPNVLDHRLVRKYFNEAIADSAWLEQRKHLEPIGGASPRPKAPAGPSPPRPRGGSQPPRLPPDRDPDEDEEEAANVLQELEAFGASLEEQSTAVSGLLERRAELSELFEASRREVAELHREMDELASSADAHPQEADDDQTLCRAREALGLAAGEEGK
eukprot:s1521_g3.t1